MDGELVGVASQNEGGEVTCDRRVTRGCVSRIGLVTSAGWLVVVVKVKVK